MGEGLDFKLYIYREGNQLKELLFPPEFFSNHIKLDFFGITNALLKAIPEKFVVDSATICGILSKFISNIGFDNQPILQEIKLDDSKFNEIVLEIKHDYESIKGGFLEKPLSFRVLQEEILSPSHSLLEEFLSIHKALTDWLMPTGKGRAGKTERQTPSKKYIETWKKDNLSQQDSEFLEPENFLHLQARSRPKEATSTDYIRDDISVTHGDIFLHEARLERNAQFSTRSPEPIFINGKGFLAESFTSSKGLLPLLWAEIIYAVKNDIFANQCDFCKKWFPIINGSGMCGKGTEKRNIGYRKLNQKYCSLVCRKIATDRKNKANPYYYEIKKLQMQRKRAETQEEKDILTKRIDALKNRKK